MKISTIEYSLSTAQRQVLTLLLPQSGVLQENR